MSYFIMPRSRHQVDGWPSCEPRNILHGGASFFGGVSYFRFVTFSP